jgi:DNA gyrase subunit A
MGRTTRGVTLFKTAEDENVVSVTRLRDVDDDDEGESDDEAGETSDETVGDEVEADS